LFAKLGSITDTLTLTDEYAYANDFEVRLRDFTGPSGLLLFGPLGWCVICDWSE